MRSNEELVSFIQETAHSKGLSVTNIEKEAGLSNGRIGKWAKQKRFPPHDKLVLVAALLQVPLAELTGEQKETPAAGTDTDDELTSRLARITSLAAQMDVDQLRNVESYVEFLLRKQ